MKREKTHQPVRSGTMTLLIAIILVVMAVLSVLALNTARADLAMAERQYELLTVQKDAQLAGEEWLAEMDALGEEGIVATDINVKEEYTLHVEAEFGGRDVEVRKWQLERIWQPEDELNVWKGE